MNRDLIWRRFRSYLATFKVQYRNMSWLREVASVEMLGIKSKLIQTKSSTVIVSSAEKLMVRTMRPWQ